MQRIIVPAQRFHSEELMPGVSFERFYPGGMNGPNGECRFNTPGGQGWTDSFLLGDNDDAFQMLVPDIRLPANQLWPLHWHDCWTARVPQDLRALINSEISAAQSCTLPLGMARHALETFLELARTRGINHLGYARMADAPVVQTAVARAAVDIKLIEAFQQSSLAARTGGAVLDPGEAALLSIGSVRCFELARGVIESLFALAPSTEIHRTKSLQRLLRDVHVFEHQHAASPFINYELYGRRFFAS